MDDRLVAWGRAVKARRRFSGLPPLWLFTDPDRMPDLEAAIAALPRGLCGVVFRHDGVPCRAALLRRVALLCRSRQIPLVVAGEPAGAPPWVGRHLRAGRGRRSRTGLTTSSAHGAADLVRATKAGAGAIFLSPVFATTSHPGARPLGPVRFGSLARSFDIAIYALGGVTGQTATRLPPGISGAGAIGALLRRNTCNSDATVFRNCHGNAS